MNQPLQRFLLADRADPAGNALSAGFVAEKSCDAQKDALEVDVSSNGMMTPEPSVAPIARDAFERQRRIQLCGRNESARRAAQQHCLQASVASHAAGQFDQSGVVSLRRELRTRPAPPHGRRGKRAGSPWSVP